MKMALLLKYFMFCTHFILPRKYGASPLPCIRATFPCIRATFIKNSRIFILYPSHIYSVFEPHLFGIQVFTTNLNIPFSLYLQPGGLKFDI